MRKGDIYTGGGDACEAISETISSRARMERWGGGGGGEPKVRSLEEQRVKILGER